MKQKSFYILILLAFLQLGFAQTADKKFAIGLNGISTKYIGDLGGNAFTDFTFSQYCLGYFGGGISLNYYLSPSFDLGINGNYGLYGAYHNFSSKFLSTKFESSLFGHYKLNNGYIISKDSKWSPFLSLGVGFASYGEVKDYAGWADYDGTDIIVPVGAGVKYQITDAFAVQYQYNYNFTNADNHDKVTGGKNDAFGEHLLGVVFSLGKNKDTDKDGVADKYDLCPDTPVNVKVDEKGCPIDTDKDGVADYLDKCPNSLPCEKVDANGCPVDSDNDGVIDNEDRCPATPAGVKVDAKGCPVDTDNDGVADYLDKCSNTPARVQVDANGCPLDTDNDGVADYFDKCPEVKGTAANKGCPDISAETQNIFSQALQGIQFIVDSYEIKPISNPILNKVVEVMKQNPSYNIEINGHTDSTGSEDYNLELSQKRADEVRKYFVEHGIDASRLTTKGHGETQPVVDNTTPANRHKNRRVEFIVSF
ncbi:MAG: OmpA family protein [Paludibacter sp.]